jgi:hypothetical protein
MVIAVFKKLINRFFDLIGVNPPPKSVCKFCKNDGIFFFNNQYRCHEHLEVSKNNKVPTPKCCFCGDEVDEIYQSPISYRKCCKRYVCQYCCQTPKHDRSCNGLEENKG